MTAKVSVLSEYFFADIESGDRDSVADLLDVDGPIGYPYDTRSLRGFHGKVRRYESLQLLSHVATK